MHQNLNDTVLLNFKNLKVDEEFNIDGYAIEVANEIIKKVHFFN